jgi:hypothetical protein
VSADTIDIVLLVLKVAILVLLYLFVWWVVRRTVRDTVSGQAAAPPPDVALPAAELPPAPVTPQERVMRRVQRESERTVDGQVLDFTPHINPRLVVEQSTIVPPGVIFPLEGWVTVGRASTSSIVLDEATVSSTHARLTPRDQFYFVEDLGSTNGTYLNERAVTEAQLKLDSRLRIGETVFRYEE